MKRHRHRWTATLYGGRWIEYCACGTERPARLDRYGKPVSLR